MAQKKYVSLTRLSDFLDNLKGTFAALSHKHKLSDITDYKIDTELSSTSTNPVQNKVLDAEFDAISEALSVYDLALNDKANASHTHDDRYYTESEINTKLSAINTSITNITSGTTAVKEAEHADTADSANTATSATKATQDGNGKVISSTYETKTDASAKLTEAKSYADSVAASAANTVKNDLLNNAGSAYDTLKELGDLIDDNKDAIDALETIASGKSDKDHTHDYLPLSGGIVTGTTVFSKVQDAAADSYNSPAVVIGGDPTTYHLELDNNEIQAKQSETKAGNLFLNSNGGTVHVGFDGLKMDSESSIIPEYAVTSNVGTAELPFNRMYSRYHYLYGDANASYGNFRVGTTGTASTAGVATLELGNNIAKGTVHNASGKITMYGSGTAFTNILPSTRTSGSNAVTLPTTTGTLVTDKELTSAIETRANISTVTTAEYNALEEAEAINANTLYIISDANEDDIELITVADIDEICTATIAV